MEQAELIGMFIGQAVVSIQLGLVEAMRFFNVGVGMEIPIPFAVTTRGGEQGAEYDRHAAALVFGPAQQGIVHKVRDDRSLFAEAGLVHRASIVPPENKHVPSQVLVSVHKQRQVRDLLVVIHV
jgi:hypothetical protein